MTLVNEYVRKRAYVHYHVACVLNAPLYHTKTREQRPESDSFNCVSNFTTSFKTITKILQPVLKQLPKN